MNGDRPEEEAATTPVVPELLGALGAAVERGRHIALIAAEGAGLARLHAAAAVRDLEAGGDDGGDGDGGKGRVFVLCAAVDRARRCAAGMFDAVAAAGREVVVVGPGAAAEAAERADILVGTPAAVLEAVRRGDVSATAVRALVLDDVCALEPARVAVEALLQGAGGETRRIAATHARDAGFDELVERWLPRARRWPKELFAEPQAKASVAGGGSARPVAVSSRATRAGRLARLAELLHDLTQSDGVGVDTAEGDTAGGNDGTAGAGGAVSVETAPGAVAAVRAALATAGCDVAEPGQVRVGAWGEVDSAPHAVLFGLPATPGPLAEAAARADRCYAIVDPLRERQFELLAARAGVPVAPLGEPVDHALLDDISAFRARVADALEQQDAASGALLLAPLIEEHGAARVAGALAGLLRAADRTPPAQTPGRPPAAPEADRPRTSRDTRPDRRSATPTDAHARRATRPTWTRVFVGVGKRDGAGPGDLVGAITGETSVSGGQIGRIEIRHNFSLVDVDSLVADEVVRGLDGRRIKGRDIVARLDRGAAGG